MEEKRTMWCRLFIITPSYYSTSLPANPKDYPNLDYSCFIGHLRGQSGRKIDQHRLRALPNIMYFHQSIIILSFLMSAFWGYVFLFHVFKSWRARLKMPWTSQIVVRGSCSVFHHQRLHHVAAKHPFFASLCIRRNRNSHGCETQFSVTCDDLCQRGSKKTKKACLYSSGPYRISCGRLVS